MEASAGLVAGSHNRNELVVIRRDGDPGPKPLRQQKRQVCQICGDGVGLTPDGEPFVACNECAFPFYRDCYGYERREGTQNCPQCKTRFKRLKGCACVPRDEEEDGVDDLENEFNWRDRNDSQYVAESMLHAHMSYGRGGTDSMACHSLFSPSPMFPSSPTGKWSMTSRQSSTRLCRLSWAAGERGSTAAHRIRPSRISMFSITLITMYSWELQQGVARRFLQN